MLISWIFFPSGCDGLCQVYVVLRKKRLGYCKWWAILVRWWQSSTDPSIQHLTKWLCLFVGVIFSWVRTAVSIGRCLFQSEPPTNWLPWRMTPSGCIYEPYSFPRLPAAVYCLYTQEWQYTVVNRCEIFMGHAQQMGQLPRVMWQMLLM